MPIEEVLYKVDFPIKQLENHHVVMSSYKRFKYDLYPILISSTGIQVEYFWYIWNNVFHVYMEYAPGKDDMYRCFRIYDSLEPQYRHILPKDRNRHMVLNRDTMLEGINISVGEYLNDYIVTVPAMGSPLELRSVPNDLPEL